MAAVPVGKRRFHAFLSHAHVDEQRADELYEWLRDVAEVSVWYDAVNMPPGSTIAQALPDAIENSRAMILLLSRESVGRRWVEQEYFAAINHQTQHSAFRIIPVRLDDVSPPGFLQNYSNVTLGKDGLDVGSATAILKGLYQPPTAVDPRGGRDAYFSRGWRAEDTPLADQVGAAVEGAGLQLIGDSEDQPSWVEDRVLGLIEGCGAFVAVLPYRKLSPHGTSKYILREWELAVARDLPCLVVADPRIALPADVAKRRGLVPAASGGETVDADDLAAAAATLAEDWNEPMHSPYAFYAADFDAARADLRQAVRELVETVAVLPCVLGEYVTGAAVQREIVRAVAGASFVLADVSGDKPNVYIEVGAARAANVPFYILRQGPPGRPVFMLRDQQVWNYEREHDLLGRVLRIVYPYRRSVVSAGHV